MKKFLSNYKTTIILLVAIIVGAIVGIIFQEKATILQPLGDVFLNLLLVIIVPLIFLTITTSIAKMKNPERSKDIDTFEIETIMNEYDMIMMDYLRHTNNVPTSFITRPTVANFNADAYFQLRNSAIPRLGMPARYAILGAYNMPKEPPKKKRGRPKKSI